MKDFIKWLGVNEKVAKVVVWVFLIMIALIITNASLVSIGAPHYQINYENIKEVMSNKTVETILGILVCIANFFCIIFLVFRVKEFKKMIKYSLIYVILNWVITEMFNYAVAQAFIVVFVLALCFFYSKRNWKYIFYGMLAIIVNIVVEGITYLYKMKFIDLSTISTSTRALISIDYFIIMVIIILVKEILLKKGVVKSNALEGTS